MDCYRPQYEGEYVGEGKWMSNHEVHCILDQFVSCPSVFGSEYELGQLIAKIATDHGLIVECQPVSEKRENILMTVGTDSFQSEKHALLFHGHYDTVPALDMTEAFSTRVRNNMMWGRGSVDQKGGLVAALCAAIAMKRTNRPFKKSLCIAAVVDEESEHRGSYVLAQSDIDAEYAIVTEPTNTHAVEFGVRGTSPIRIRVEGKTAHAGIPHKGVNAIEKALPILEELFKMEFPILDLGELGTVQGTLCVSMMNAGTAYNNVPHEAVIWLDRRTVMGETSTSALRQVRDMLDKVHQRDPSVIATADIARPDWSWQPIMDRGLNPTLTPVDSELFNILQRSANKSRVGVLEKRFAGGYYDMDFLVNDLGIPTLVYGPGDISLAHSASEEIDIDDVCRVTDVFCHTIEELCL